MTPAAAQPDGDPFDPVAEVVALLTTSADEHEHAGRTALALAHRQRAQRLLDERRA